MTDTRICAICESPLERRVGEKLCSFLARKSCSPKCLTWLLAAHRVSQEGGAEGEVIEIARGMQLAGQCFAPHNLNLKSDGVFTMARPAPTPTLTHIGAYDSRYTADDM